MRSTATLTAALVLLLVQSMIMEIAPAPIVAPAFGLLAVLHVGLSPKWALSSASVVAFATGYLLDLVSGAPHGVHAFVFVVMVLFLRLLAGRMAVRGFVLKAATSFVATLVAAFLIVAVRAVVSPEGGYGGLRQAPLEALLTGLCGPAVLWLFFQLDGRLDPARLRVGLSRRRARVPSGVGPR